MAKKAVKSNESGASKDEQIGIHKGSLSTLAKERQELMRLLQIVEQLMQMHIGALKQLGVDLEAQAKEAMKQSGKSKKKDSGAIEEML
ncbi:hypothetical protein KY325_01670 [Candidatus Woesearchaeota archaeon]|nr:hypothetical protein [Candidatus Woesearchaeota archaeon]MBW3017846.1 hypothetical protein [Candidatus Woesearchaeota archaeon]